MRQWLEQYLKRSAQKVLDKNQELEIVGITGSVGKSSTKEAVFSVLNNSKKFKNKVKRSIGNLNSEIGLPLSILGYTKQPSKFAWPFVLAGIFFKANFSNPLSEVSILILEYSSDKPGDIKDLTEIARPKIGIITKIGLAHTLTLKNLNGVAKEKGYLAEVLPPDGLLILNKDDKYCNKITKRTKAKVRYFSGTVKKPEYEAAKQLARYYKIPVDQVGRGLKKVKQLPRRLNELKGINHTIVIDDTYNANPDSMKRALDFLADYQSKGRKIAVLGDMLELGKTEESVHQDIAKLANKQADIFVAVGNKFRVAKSDAWFMDSEQAANYLLRKIKKNDIILVKGSNAMGMQKIVKKLIV